MFCSLKVVHEKDIDQMIDQFHILRSNDKDYSKESIENYSNEVKRVFWGWINKTEWMAQAMLHSVRSMIVLCWHEDRFMSIEGNRWVWWNPWSSSQNLTSVVLLPVGYRSEEDKYQHKTKVRKPNNILFVDD